ncbi:hypothetical protein AB0J21_26575 [Streptomyces sp. NPDC049954]|uniref:hypothetical protein n=1 Tax=Streptomyces sp. NPDC049954 TaxID=3155779 RepID=UPI00341DFD32
MTNDPRDIQPRTTTEPAESGIGTGVDPEEPETFEDPGAPYDPEAPEADDLRDIDEEAAESADPLARKEGEPANEADRAEQSRVVEEAEDEYR